MRSNLIAIGSTRLVGKDTFAQCFNEICTQKLPDWNVEILHFADPLKYDLNEFTIPKYGIDLFNCSPEEKELVRPMMIEHGRIKRSQTKGTYFTNLTEIKINEIRKLRPKTIFCIADFRYCAKISGYPEDEDVWVKKMGGIIVDIKRFNVDKINLFGGVSLNFIETDIPDEIKNSKAITADYEFVWQTTNNQELRKAYVQEFFDWWIK